jgi:hypothetical protein
MGGKVLKRELESYEKAYQQYLRRVRDYNKESKEYNKAVEYYNASFVMDENGNKLVYTPDNQLMAINSEGNIVSAKLPKPEPVQTTTQNQYGMGQTQTTYTPPNPYEPTSGAYGSRSLPAGVQTLDVGGGYKAPRSYAAEAPGEMPAQPAPLSMQAPDPTRAQLQKVNQANWSDIERGLIGQVIRSR